MASDDEMDVEKVHESLAKALRLQLGSLLTMTMLAGTLRGMTSAAVKSQLRDYVRAEIDDTYLLAEKLTALGGSVPTSVPDLVLPTATDKALTAFLDNEADVLAALHAVIAATGQEPHSEALEHLLEHVIMRKQQQVDFIHPRGRPGLTRGCLVRLSGSSRHGRASPRTSPPGRPGSRDAWQPGSGSRWRSD